MKQILSINPFTVKALWSDDKVRVTDFGRFLSEYFQKKESLYYKILQENTFKQAKADGRTIYWEGITEMIDYDGKKIPAPLDFCPDVLFEQSVLAD